MQSSSRAEVLRMLSAAISQATAGELHRAVEFLEFARSVRIGKHDLRNRSRKAAQTRHRDSNQRAS